VNEPVSILDADGNAPRGAAPNLTAAELRRLFTAMLRTRLLDEHARALRTAGRIERPIGEQTGDPDAAAGREATHVGAASALDDFDWVFPGHHQPGVLVLRGVPFEEIVSEWFGAAHEPAKGRQQPGRYSFRRANFVSASGLPGTQLNQATGAAMAARARGEDAAFLTFCDDAGVASSDFHAGLNFAAVYKTPLVVVVEREATAADATTDRATAYGLPSVVVDGNDVLAVHRVCREAVDRARRGDGATLVEAVTSFGAGDGNGDWRSEDPIARCRRYLQRRELWDETFEAECREQAATELLAATEHAAQAAPPTPASMFDDVFMNLSPQLREQRATLT